MTRIKELRLKAKELGIKGYSVLCKKDLESVLDGKPPAPKKLRKNQISQASQTNNLLCKGCEMKRVVHHLQFKANANNRYISYYNDMEINPMTGDCRAQINQDENLRSM